MTKYTYENHITKWVCYNDFGELQGKKASNMHPLEKKVVGGTVLCIYALYPLSLLLERFSGEDEC